MADRRIVFDGVTHVFPDDFTDEEIAAALSSPHASPTMKAVSESEPGTGWGGAIRSLKQQFSEAAGPVPAAGEMPFAHASGPKVQEFMNTPLVRPTGIDAVDGFTSPAGLAMTAAAGGMALQHSPTVQRITGRGLQWLGNLDVTHPLKSTVGWAGDALERSAARAGSPNATWTQQPDPPAPTPPMVDTPAAGKMAASRTSSGPPPAAAAGPGPAAAPGMSAAERARLVRQGFSPDVIAKIEALEQSPMPQGRMRMGPAPAAPPIQVDQASLPEAWKPLATAPPPNPSTTRLYRSEFDNPATSRWAHERVPGENPNPKHFTPNEELARTIHGSSPEQRVFYIDVPTADLPKYAKPTPTSPFTTSGPNAEYLLPEDLTAAARNNRLPSPMQGPRVAVGAEQVGRGVGMSKEEVRAATSPILGEAQGAASPILPEASLGRIIDTLKAMPPGSAEREAYVARATSGKAQWQIENIRRTLEHLGLIVPVATGVESVRDAVMRRLSGAGAR